MTQDEINEMRSRIAELEQSDADFARKSNLLLDEIIVNRDSIAENTKAIAESRRDIDQLAARTGELAQSISELRQTQQLLAFTVGQVLESMTILRQTQQITTDRFVETFTRFQEEAIADRQAFQAEIQRIWEYLTTTRPNGRGEQGGGG